MDLQTIEKKLKASKRELSRRFGIKELGIFGSYARGEQKKNSDVDILVEFKKTPGFFGYIKAENYLTELLGAKVDLTIGHGLDPIIAKRIANELVSV